VERGVGTGEKGGVEVGDERRVCEVVSTYVRRTISDMYVRRNV